MPMTVKMGLPPLWPGMGAHALPFPVHLSRETKDARSSVRQCTSERHACDSGFAMTAKDFPSHSVVPTVCPQSHSACCMSACLPSACATAEARWRGLCYQLIEWLTRKHPNAKTAFLPFYGKNQVY